MFTIFSLVVCIVISLKMETVNCQKTLKTFSTLNIIALVMDVAGAITGIVSLICTVFAIMSYSSSSLPKSVGILTSVGVVSIFASIILLVWHIEIMKKLRAIPVAVADTPSEGVVYCDQCGSALPFGTAFCTNCGHEMRREALK